MNRNAHYEPAPEYNASAYVVKGWRGVAFDVLGWETEPDEDTEWSGYKNRTGSLVAVMVGDDRHHSVDPSDIEPLTPAEYCSECGQIGCSHGRATDELTG